jgi:excisionase family DNA binding protein
MALARMRTIDEAFDLLREEDPGCCLTRCALRRMVTTGRIPSVRVGAKYLINMDILEHYLAEGFLEEQ